MEDNKTVQVPGTISEQKQENIGINLPSSLTQVSKIIIESRIKAANATGYKKIIHFFLSYQIPILLLIAIIIGLTLPQPGTYLAKNKASTYLLIIIFFLAGVGLRTDEMKDMLHHKTGVIMGFLATSVLSPMISFIIMSIKYDPISFPLGLTILMSGPSALSSGVVLADVVGGNGILALLVTMDANIFGVILEPYLLKLILNSFNIKVTLDIPKLLLKIVYSLIVPLICGKLFSYIPRVTYYYTKYKVSIKLISNICLIMIPWMDVSKSASKILNIGGIDILYCLGMGLFCNILLALLNIIVCYVSCVPINDAKAIIFVGCGKSIPGAANILDFMPADVMDKGLAVVPMIVMYLLSIFTNSFACSLWIRYDQKHQLPTKLPKLPSLEEESNTQPIFVDKIDDYRSSIAISLQRETTLTNEEIIKMPTFMELFTTMTGEKMI